MEEYQIEIVEDVKASPLSEYSRLSEASKVVGLKAPLKRQLETLWGNAKKAENFTIFRTPHSISQSKKNLFEPSVISIGPFHRGEKHLQPLEEKKRWVLRDFLSRKDNISLDLCLSAMKSLETRTRRCYNETFDDLDSDTFVEMMLLDGCFVLEYLEMMEENWESIREVGWNCQFITRDLLLQENQIPFFIVDKLLELIGYNQDARMDFAKHISFVLSAQTLSDECVESIETIPDPPAEIHHLVHLCYHCLVPNPEKPVVLSSKSFDLTRMFSTNKIEGLLHRFFSRVLNSRVPKTTRKISSMVIPSATELKQKGLKFKPKSNPKHMLDISFEYGVLKIPTLIITDSTKPIFTNLIAFEHSKYGKNDSPFTRFVYLLDNLVNTQNDVTILQECGIIENLLSSEEEVTHFFNQVTEGGALGDGHYLAELNRELNIYIGSIWNRQQANLIQDYFSSPWAAISLFAAFILLVLTCIQTFYAVYAYKFPPSS